MKAIIKFFCSLRLTVVLLGLGVALVFIGTLAQVDEGLYAAQHRYFRSLFIWWTPGGSQFKLPVFPGGYLIGGLLLLNLFSAHAQRFKFTWKKSGILLVHAGVVLLLLGQFATDLLSTEGAMRMFEGETKNYSEDFRSSELVVVDTSDPRSDQVVAIPESLLTRPGEIRHPSLPVRLRVQQYWPNCEVEDRPPAEAIATGATNGSFADRLVLPLPEPASAAEGARAAALIEVVGDQGPLGTWLVPSRTQERQTFKHGDREWAVALVFAPMMGGNQLIVTDAASRSMEGMISIPEAELARKGELRREGLPVTLRVKEFWPNCRLYRKPVPASVFPKATQGAFANAMVTPRPPVADMDNRNIPAALVEVLADSGPVGTWLLAAGFSTRDGFTLGGRRCDLALRFTRYYKPFTITLLKATHDKYRGTEIPKNFASRVRVENPARGEARETVIYMNNPLRYEGYTLFQYQMAADEMALQQNQAPSSTFQVVKNPGWLTPYVSCALVATGLVVQFLMHLVGFALKRRTA